ncbi:MAG: hypothetical protein ACR2L5_02975 [Candidatus Actinomarinaceae bacterium]
MNKAPQNLRKKIAEYQLRFGLQRTLVDLQIWFKSSNRPMSEIHNKQFYKKFSDLLTSSVNKNERITSDKIKSIIN